VAKLNPQPGDILVRYSRIPATNEYDEIGRYLVLDKIGSTRQVGEWMFSQVGDKWKILVESGLSWEGELK